MLKLTLDQLFRKQVPIYKFSRQSSATLTFVKSSDFGPLNEFKSDVCFPFSSVFHHLQRKITGALTGKMSDFLK